MARILLGDRRQKIPYSEAIRIISESPLSVQEELMPLLSFYEYEPLPESIVGKPDLPDLNSIEFLPTGQDVPSSWSGALGDFTLRNPVDGINLPQVTSTQSGPVTASTPMTGAEKWKLGLDIFNTLAGAGATGFNIWQNYDNAKFLKDQWSTNLDFMKRSYNERLMDRNRQRGIARGLRGEELDEFAKEGTLEIDEDKKKKKK